MTSINSGSSNNVSAPAIRAQGEADERRLRVKFTGIALGILCVGGIGCIWFQPSIAKDVWLFLGPVISGGLSFLVTGRGKGA